MSQKSKMHTCVILTRCRTGSTTLTRSMEQLPAVSVFPEILNGTQEGAYQAFLVKKLRECGGSEDYIRHGPLFSFPQYLDQLRCISYARKGNPSHLVIECKIENLFVYGNNWTNPTLEMSNIPILQYLIQNADAMVFVRRRDFVARYCSDYVANWSGVFHAADGMQVDPAQGVHIPKVTLDVEQAVNNFRKEVTFDATMLEYLKATHHNVGHFFYEDIYDPTSSAFRDSFTKTFAEVTSGIEIGKAVMGRARLIRDRDVVCNYDALLDAIAKDHQLMTVFEFHQPLSAGTDHLK